MFGNREWLTAREASEYVGVHVNTIYNWVHGDLRAYRVRGVIRIYLPDLEAFLRFDSYLENDEGEAVGNHSERNYP